MKRGERAVPHSLRSMRPTSLRSLIGNGVERRALKWEIGRDPCRFGRAHGGAERRALPYVRGG